MQNNQNRWKNKKKLYTTNFKTSTTLIKNHNNKNNKHNISIQKNWLQKTKKKKIKKKLSPNKNQ